MWYYRGKENILSTNNNKQISKNSENWVILNEQTFKVANKTNLSEQEIC